MTKQVTMEDVSAALERYISVRVNRCMGTNELAEYSRLLAAYIEQSRNDAVRHAVNVVGNYVNMQ